MKIEDTYNGMSTFAKEEVGFPDTFINLTREQESFIMELFDFERNFLKGEMLVALKEMKDLVDEL